MPPPRAASTLVALVLALRNTGEGHRVVHAFDRDHGLVGVWARNARTSRKRLAGTLEPFYTVKMTAVAQSGLYSLQAAEVVKERSAIRQSLAAIGRAANLCNLVRTLFPEGQAALEVFTGLEVALDHVVAGRVARAAGLYPRLALQAGLLPDLDACGRCAAPLPAGTGMVALRGEPGVLCRLCAPRGRMLLPATAEGLRGARIEEAAAADEVERTVMDWLSSHAGKHLAQWRPV